MSIKDRGKIKWQPAYFMPEQIKLLKEADKKETYKTMPKLSEEQLEEMNYTICEAMEYDQSLAITYFKNHDFHIMIGKIHHVDAIKQTLYIVDSFSETSTLKLKDIVDVRNHE